MDMEFMKYTLIHYILEDITWKYMIYLPVIKQGWLENPHTK